MNPKSTKGHATKARILEAAINLIYERGANGTSVDDILKASNTGKSQFYHYFLNKDQLLLEVLKAQREKYPGKNLSDFNFASAEGINNWLSAVRKDFLAGQYQHGCPIGNLASELGLASEEVKSAVVVTIAGWEAELTRGLKAQKLRGYLKPNAEPAEIAVFIISVIEGALLLSKTSSSPRYIDAAVNQINQYVKLQTVSSGSKLNLPRTSTLGFCP
jgi:TetR/AcrR family transcriptional repressor of nem operon